MEELITNQTLKTVGEERLFMDLVETIWFLDFGRSGYIDTMEEDIRENIPEREKRDWNDLTPIR